MKSDQNNPSQDQAQTDLSVLSCPATAQQSEPGSFIQAFDAMVSERGSAPAIIDDGQAYSYDEVQQRTLALAHQLTKRGVMPGDLVAVSLERGVDLICTLIGVMRAGAAYVPLDPKHPPSRINLVLSEADPRLVVHNDATADSFDATQVRGRFDLTHMDWQFAGAISTTIPNLNTAYVIFTSGSTGRPKGVRVPHTTLIAFLRAMQTEPGMASTDRIAALTTVSFDISVCEMFWPLIAGAATVVVPFDVSKDGRRLGAQIERDEITVVQATPTTFQILIAGGWRQPAPLRKILCGGEAMPDKLATQLVERAEEVWNMYGPTETTVWSTCYRLDPDAPQPSIGTPIHGTDCYVLDEQHQLLPVGEAGQLFIGGMGVTEGYHHNPDKTAEAFVDVDPFGGEALQRLYKTGDRVVQGTDGLLHYHGRMDFQVKIRGFRVELPEIEHVATQHPQVKEAVVTTTSDATGAQALHGFFTLASADSAVTSGELLEHLRSHLPDYMIPISMRQIDQMPVNSNGKIDRHALPEPNIQVSDEVLNADEIPELERRIYQAWCEVLGLPACGIDDNFFELGGHSIGAVMLTQRVEEITDMEVSLGALFENPTLGGFFASVRSGSAATVSVRVPLNEAATARTGTRTLYFICGINIYEIVAQELPADQAAFAVYVEQERSFLEADAGKAPLSFQALANEYVTAIKRANPSGQLSLCGISFGGALALEVASQLEREGFAVDNVVMLDTVAAGARRKKKPILRRILSRLKRELRARVTERSASAAPVVSPDQTPAHSAAQMRREQRAAFDAAMRNADLSQISYQGNVILIRAEDGSDCLDDESPQQDYYWSEILNRPVHVEGVGGDHLGMVEGDNGRQVAALMKNLI